MGRARRTRRAYPALHATGAACRTGAAAVATWLTGSELRWRQAPASVLTEILGDRDPGRLADLVRRLAERPLSADVPYELMAGLVRLAGCRVPTSEAYVRGWMDHIGWARRNAGTVIGNLRKDPHLAELAAALFEIEEIGARSNWRYGDGPNNWTYALTQLTREGLLDHKVMVDACAARLLRGGASTADNKVFLGVAVWCGRSTPGCGRSRTGSGPTRRRSCWRHPPGARGYWSRANWWRGSTRTGSRACGRVRRTSRRRCCACGATAPTAQPRSRPPRWLLGSWGAGDEGR
ncbi:hypothetical protein [Streptomyces adelaidensis]|uniref:hypothetical protein n=1 Tax=Streptomyces adelaidensis TaxID=2796465 RepID=UPI0019061CA8|nr:hypothetical protein [Streptomyces adelaidensis]